MLNCGIDWSSSLTEWLLLKGFDTSSVMHDQASCRECISDYILFVTPPSFSPFPLPSPLPHPHTLPNLLPLKIFFNLPLALLSPPLSPWTSPFASLSPSPFFCLTCATSHQKSMLGFLWIGVKSLPADVVLDSGNIALQCSPCEGMAGVRVIMPEQPYTIGIIWD